MKQMAEALGLSVQSVSLALNDKRGVSEATRERVKAYAEKVGYQPDAGLKALADYRTGQKKLATRWSQVALVHNWPTQTALFEDLFYQSWFAELQQAAKARGIRIESYWLGHDGSRTRAVFRTLRNRGITGVFYAPPSLTTMESTIVAPEKRFQVVTFGPEHLYPNLHTVQFDFYENLRLAWKVLLDRGHRKIGLVYSKHQAWRTGYAWRAAYHIEKLLAGGIPGQNMPLEIDVTGAHEPKEQYLEWASVGNYDAVISSIPEVADWMNQAGRDFEIAMLNVNRPALQGIDLNLSLMARTAVDLLTIEMQRSLQVDGGLPFRVHIPGRWVDAESSDSIYC